MHKAKEKPPKFLMRSSAGKLNHLFSIEPEDVEILLQHLKIEDPLPNPMRESKKPGVGEPASLFGSVSADGCVQVWDLMKRRPILTLNTHLPTTSWAEFCSKQPKAHQGGNSTSASHTHADFFLYSRKSGLYCHSGCTFHKSSLVRLPIDDIHFGFCKPVQISPQLAVCPGGGNSVSKISHVDSKTPSVHPIPTSGPVTFLQNIPGHNRILLGTEDGKVSLIDVSSSTTLATCNLHEHIKERSHESESGLIALCSDGDEITGNFLIGTASEELILIEIQNLIPAPEEKTPTEHEHLKVIKVVRVHRRGTSAIKIHPDKTLAVVAGWDTQLRIFSFPQIKLITTMSFHSMTVSSLLFVPAFGPSRSTHVRSNLEHEAKAGSSISNGISKNMNLGSYFLLSASHDSSVAVWDDFYNQNNNSK